MERGSRVYHVYNPTYQGIIVNITKMGDIEVEWENNPGQIDTVHPHDIEESDYFMYDDQWYAPVREQKVKRMNNILGV